MDKFYKQNETAPNTIRDSLLKRRNDPIRQSRSTINSIISKIVSYKIIEFIKIIIYKCIDQQIIFQDTCKNQSSGRYVFSDCHFF